MSRYWTVSSGSLEIQSTLPVVHRYPHHHHHHHRWYRRRAIPTLPSLRLSYHTHASPRIYPCQLWTTESRYSSLTSWRISRLVYAIHYKGPLPPLSLYTHRLTIAVAADLLEICMPAMLSWLLRWALRSCQRSLDTSLTTPTHRYMLAYILTYIHTYIHTYYIDINRCLHVLHIHMICIRIKNMHGCINTYIHTYIHTSVSYTHLTLPTNREV